MTASAHDTEAWMAAREAAVLGAPLRIAPLEAGDIGAAAHALADAIHAVPGILHDADAAIDYGARPDGYFAIMARHIGVYRCQIETGVQLLGHGTIPAHQREMAVLRTAWLAGAPYEWGEHVRIARSVGITAQITGRITIGSGAAGWSAHEAALLGAVEDLVDTRLISEPHWQVLAASWDARQLIELPALVGQYLAVAMIQNALRVPLNPYNNGLRER